MQIRSVGPRDFGERLCPPRGWGGWKWDLGSFAVDDSVKGYFAFPYSVFAIASLCDQDGLLMRIVT